MTQYTNTLADGASSAASHGILGGGASVAAILGIAWMYHHAHRTALETKSANGKLKHDPRRTVVAAFLLGVLLTAGGGAIGGAISHGAGSVASILG